MGTKSAQTWPTSQGTHMLDRSLAECDGAIRQKEMRALSRKGSPSKWRVFAKIKFCAHLAYISTEYEASFALWWVGGQASVLQ